MAMSSKQYNEFIHQIEYIINHGTKEGLEELYKRILAETGDRDNLKRLDSLHNSKWTIRF